MTLREGIRAALQLLLPRDRRLLFLAIGIQISTSALELLGVALLGLVAALSVTTVQSSPPPELVGRISSTLGIEHLPSESLVLFLAAAAAVVLLVKSVVSGILTRRVLIFLANRQALISARLTASLLNQSLSFLQRRTSQETAYALTQGVGAATTLILGGLVVAVTEIALFLVLGTALFLIDPVVALAAFGYFALLAVLLHRALGGWATRVGHVSALAEVASLNAVQEAIAVYREITVLDRRELYVDRFQAFRWQAASVAADQVMIGLIPKYLFETALVIGGVVLGAVLLATEDAAAAVGTLTLFLVAAGRMMPSLLRLQGAALSLRGGAAGAGPTFALAKELSDQAPKRTTVPAPLALLVRERIREGHPGFVGSIELSSVTFSYPNTPAPALSDITLEVRPGQSVALIGRSGAGKTTLADVVLGVSRPTAGIVRVGGLPPEMAIRRWPGAIAYVPQTVVIVSGSVRENVALGLPADSIDDDLVWRALERAHLASLLDDGREGLDTQVGEGGIRLSGGQRQRLGIARALYTSPGVLVLDEATSALDAETEDVITRTLASMSGVVTRLTIAHRLSTVRDSDLVVYLQSGLIEAAGTFEEVRQRVPALNRQAQLMGLNYD